MAGVLPNAKIRADIDEAWVFSFDFAQGELLRNGEEMQTQILPLRGRMTTIGGGRMTTGGAYCRGMTMPGWDQQAL